MAQNLKDDILESKPYVDIILGPDSHTERFLLFLKVGKRILIVLLIQNYQGLRFIKIYFQNVRLE